MKPDDLSLTVLGSEGIDFSEGWETGNMDEPGISINTVWYADDMKKYGGCIDREQARQLHAFLSKCIAYWDSAATTDTQPQ